MVASVGSAVSRSGHVAFRRALGHPDCGGKLGFKWRVVSGKLPTGVRLSSTLGTLTGTEKVGTYRVTVEARDALGARSQALVLTVRS